MKIGLVDVDGHNFPNLPLMKISAYHKRRGDTVEFAIGLEHYDLLYMSKIFTFTPDISIYYEADKIIKGGTGWGINNKLDEAVKLNLRENFEYFLQPEIEHIMPDYSLYPQYPEAYGFLTRGCPRNCPFCIVSQKEGGKSVQVAELREFWQGQKIIKILDPNLLACSDREKILQSLIDSRAWIDFTQGLDIRLTDKYIAEMLKKIKVKSLHFAWDNANEDLRSQFEMVKRVTGLEHRKLIAYVLTNYNTTHEQDLFRVTELRKIGINPYTMIYDKNNAPRETRRIQAWTNNRRLWETVGKFEDLKNVFV